MGQVTGCYVDKQNSQTGRGTMRKFNLLSFLAFYTGFEGSRGGSWFTEARLITLWEQ